MSSTNKTPKYGLNQWLGTDYLKRDDLNNDNMIIENKFGTIDNTLTTHTNAINDLVYQTAGGTATALTVPMQTLGQGYAKTFIAAYNNGGVATTINGKPLYKPGTTTPPTITAGKAYTVWYNAAGGCFFSKASASGNTIAAHVLASDTFSNDIDTDLIGTMPNNGALNITPGAAAKTIPLGYTSGGTVAGDANLISANILAGKTIFGVTGKSSVVDTSDALATAAQLLSGVTAYVNGVKINGTIPSKAAASYTPGTTNQTIAIGQYISGIQTILGDANLIAANIKSGASIFGVNGKTSVVDTADGTATAAQLLSGFTAYINGTKVNGSIPSKAATTYIPGTTDQTIAAGQYISDVQTIQGDADLVSANIKAGASIFGVNGKASVVDTSDATAAAADLLSGKTVYVNGSKVTGAIPSKAAATITPGTSDQTIAAGQYLGGTQIIAGDPDLLANNIRNGMSIFGVVGNLIPRPMAGNPVDGSYSATNTNGGAYDVIPLSVLGTDWTLLYGSVTIQCYSDIALTNLVSTLTFPISSIKDTYGAKIWCFYWNYNTTTKTWALSYNNGAISSAQNIFIASANQYNKFTVNYTKMTI